MKLRKNNSHFWETNFYFYFSISKLDDAGEDLMPRSAGIIKLVFYYNLWLNLDRVIALRTLVLAADSFTSDEM